MRAVFYIDGFNFYYRRLKNQPQYKWVNIGALANTIVREGTNVLKVKYYTARVSGKVDSGSPERQQKLLAAFSTIQNIDIIYGRFLFSKKWMKLANSGF